MINDFIDKIIIECIPPKNIMMNGIHILKEKAKEIFNIELPIQDWFEEEGVDEEEITKRLLDEINQKYMKKNTNIQMNF